MKTRSASVLAILGLLGCYGGPRAPEPSPEEAAAPVREGAPAVHMLVLGTQTYPAGPSGDFSLFNLVEAWTGSDPAALKRNMKEIQSVKWNGSLYFLVATPNRLDIGRSMEDGRPEARLSFDPVTLSWFAETAAEKVKLAEWTDRTRRVLMIIHANGTRVTVRP